VSLALHSVLGGTLAGFHVTYVKDHHYRFLVASKQVGFAICALKRIISDHFDVYFHLWRDGGGGELDQRMEKMARGRSILAAGYAPQTVPTIDPSESLLPGSSSRILLLRNLART
jgi:hypothetical protein